MKLPSLKFSGISPGKFLQLPFSRFHFKEKNETPGLGLKSVKGIFKNRTPGQVVIQLTDRCNAKCPQCEMRVTNRFKRSKLSVDDIKRILDSCAEREVGAVSVTGGEPCLYFDELVEVLRYAGEIGIPYLRTGTNGFLFRGHDKPGFEKKIHKIAEKLSKTNIYTFWISIDSADPDTHEKMRGLPQVIRGIEKALPIFREYGIYPAANLGINRNVGGYIESLYDDSPFDPEKFRETFTQSFEAFYRLVSDLGFTITNACYPMSGGDLDAAYYAYATDKVIHFSRREKWCVFKALYDVIPKFRDRLRIFSPRVSLLGMIRKYSGKDDESYPCRGGIDYFFIDAASGDVFPCGYRGSENLGKLWDLNRTELKADFECRRCDWECFRDPSELFGPVLSVANHPKALAVKLFEDIEFFKIWIEDLRYYRACDFFNGRKAPDYGKLRKISAPEKDESLSVPAIRRARRRSA